MRDNIIPTQTGFIRLNSTAFNWNDGRKGNIESDLRVLFLKDQLKSVLFFSNKIDEVKLSLTKAEALQLAELILKELGNVD